MTTHTNPAGRPSPLVPGDLFARHQVVSGLRALADFLEANPAVAVNEYGHDFLIPVRAADENSAAALVDRAAALLGVDVSDETRRDGHYSAERTFGRITYRIYHIPERRRRQYRAQDSYQDNIRLDPDQDNDGDAGRAA
ncbi:hypothetical protein [Actinomadura sp. WMMA1423]|uniref:hypothetical protein n=1 Tax=Actinomadura sp. WMMA1423 TaxID=2591108 RepID=UPI00114721C4|nr:hypothetical protein [Actinomadura sp. WMMA1423]